LSLLQEAQFNKMADTIGNDALQTAGFLKNVFDAFPSLVFVVDNDVRVYHMNSAASKILGIDREQFFLKRGGEIMKCIHSTETPGGCGAAASCKDCIVRNSVNEAVHGNKIYRKSTVMELVQKGGTVNVHYFVTASPLEYEGKTFVLLVMEDITELKQTEEALRASESKLRDITSVLGEGVYVLDKDGCLAFMNPEAENLLGWTETELLGKNIHDLIHYQKADGTPLPAKDCPVLQTIHSGKSCRIAEEVLTRRDGTLLPVALVSTPIIEKGEVIGSVAAFHDITERKRSQESLRRANELLEHKATTDALTGIYNRLKFNDMAEAEIQRTIRHGTPLSLIMMDIDYFKKINDTYGHLCGDCVLREITMLVNRTIRQYDLFARWGGEEFMILSPNNDIENARQLAERLRTEIEDFDFSSAHSVTCSFGVAEFKEGDNIDSFTKRTDDALYKAKAKGRNRVELG